MLVQALSKRGGVPQYTQPHALLLSGLRAMEALFPGFSDELVAAGAKRIDWLQEMHSVRFRQSRSAVLWLHPAGFTPSCQAQLPSQRPSVVRGVCHYL